MVGFGFDGGGFGFAVGFGLNGGGFGSAMGLGLRWVCGGRREVWWESGKKKTNCFIMF